MKIIKKKTFSLLFAGLFLLQQLTTAYDTAGALGVQLHSTPMASTLEDSNAIRSYVVHRLASLQKKGISPETIVLTEEHFKAQNLYDTERSSGSKRITVSQVQHAGEGKYRLLGSINSIPFKATLLVSEEGISVEAERLDLGKTRFFPANQTAPYNLTAHPPGEMLQSAQLVITNLSSSDSIDTQSNPLLKYVKQHLAKERTNLDGDVLPLRDSDIDFDFVRSLIGQAKANSPRIPPDVMKEQALLFHAIGQIYYLKGTSPIQSERNINMPIAVLFLDLALSLNPKDFDYCYSWIQALSHIDGARDLALKEAIELSQAASRPYQIEKSAIQMAYIRHEMIREEVTALHDNPALLGRSEGWDKYNRAMSLAADTIRRADIFTKPRGLSFLGMAHIYKAQLHQLVKDYNRDSEKQDAPIPEAPEALILRDLAEGLDSLHKGFSLSIAGGARQRKHARGMLKDGLNFSARFIHIHWDEYTGEPLLEDKKNVEMLTVIESILEKTPDIYTAEERDFRVEITKVNLLETLRPAVKRVLIDELGKHLATYIKPSITKHLKKYAWNGSETTHEVIQKIKSEIADGVTLSGLAEKHLSRASAPLLNDGLPVEFLKERDSIIDAELESLRNEILTQELDLAIITACNTLSTGEHTYSKIMDKTSALMPVNDPELFSRRFEKIREYLGITLLTVLFDITTLNGDELDGKAATLLKGNDVNGLELLFTNGDWRARALATRKLRNIYQNNNNTKKEIKHIITLLRERLEGDEAWQVRYLAAEYLRDLSKSKSNGLNNGNDYQTQFTTYDAFNRMDVDAIRSAKTSGRENIIGVARMALTSEDVHTRLHAIYILGQLNAKETSGNIEALLRADENSEVIKAAADSLASLKPFTGGEIKKSIVDEDGSFTDRYRVIDATFNIVQEWKRPKAIQEGEIESFNGNRNEAYEILSDLMDTVSSSTSGGMSAEARKTLTAKMLLVDRLLSDLEAKLDDMQKRIITIIEGEMKRAQETRKEHMELITTDPDFQIKAQWIHPLLNLYDKFHSRLGDLLEFDKDALLSHTVTLPYLSLEDFEGLRANITETHNKTNNAILCLIDYKTAMGNIENSQKAALNFRQKVGDGRFISDYISVLEDFEKELLAQALSGVEFQNTEEGYQSFSVAVVNKTKFLERLASDIEHVNSQINELARSNSFNFITKEKIQAARQKIFNMVLRDVHAPPVGLKERGWFASTEMNFSDEHWKIFSGFMTKKVNLAIDVQERLLHSLDIIRLVEKANNAPFSSGFFSQLQEQNGHLESLFAELASTSLPGANADIESFNKQYSELMERLDGMSKEFSLHSEKISTLNDEFRAEWDRRTEEEAALSAQIAKEWLLNSIAASDLTGNLLPEVVNAFDPENITTTSAKLESIIKREHESYSKRCFISRDVNIATEMNNLIQDPRLHQEIRSFVIKNADGLLRDNPIVQKMKELDIGLTTHFINFKLKPVLDDNGLRDLVLELIVAVPRDIIDPSLLLEVSRHADFSATEHGMAATAFGEIQNHLRAVNRLTFLSVSLEDNADPAYVTYDDFKGRYPVVLNIGRRLKQSVSEYHAMKTLTNPDLSNIRGFLFPSHDVIMHDLRRIPGLSSPGEWNAPLQYIIMPVFDDDGLMTDVHLNIFSGDKGSLDFITLTTSDATGPFYRSFSSFEDAEDGDFSTLRYLHYYLQSGRTSYNNLVSLRSSDPSDIKLFPEYSFKLILKTLQYYRELSASSPEEVIMQNKPVDVSRVFQKIIREGVLSGTDQVSLDATEMLNSKISTHAESDVPDLTDELKQHIEGVLQGHREYRSARFADGDSKEKVDKFFGSLMTLTNTISGRDYALEMEDVSPAKTIPTLSKNQKPVVDLFALYPPVQKYSAVYFDTSTLSFKVSPLLTDHYETSVELAGALNNAFSTYFEALISTIDSMMSYDRTLNLPPKSSKAEYIKAVLEAIEKDPEKEYLGDLKVFLELKKVFETISSEGTLNVAVAKDLPVNSLLSEGNTIIFDLEFIEFLLDELTLSFGDNKAAEIVLGERIFHELGHVALKDEGLTALEEEEIQIERDVLFYKTAFEWDSFLNRKMEDFTSKKVPSKGDKKFSEAFNSGHFFKHIQKWSGKESYDKELLRERIREFVEEQLGHLYVTPSGTRLFPAAGQGGHSFTFLLANRKLEKMKDLDVEMLDKIGAHDSAFLSKKRKIVISASLIPDCQKHLIGEINKKSEEAFESGWTNDLIEIKSFSYIQNLRSDKDSDVVVLLEETESTLYERNEKHLTFKREGDSPVLINGIVAAARAVLYEDAGKLRQILTTLSGNSGLDLPDVAEIEKCLREKDHKRLARLLAITLPAIKVLSKEIHELNQNIIHLLQFA